MQVSKFQLGIPNGCYVTKAQVKHVFSGEKACFHRERWLGETPLGPSSRPRIRSSDNDSTGFWPPGSLHTLGADGCI